MKKKISIITILLLSILFVGLGCKGLSQRQKQAIQPITLDYWTVFGDVSQLQTLANQYSKRRGGYVKINVRKVRYDQFNQRFLKALADGVAPDIVSLHTRWLHRQKSRLAPMPRRVQVANLSKESGISDSKSVSFSTKQLPSKTTIREKYIQTVPEDVIIDDKVYGLPLAVDTLALYYNQDLLDKAGVPQAPTTWEELQQSVKETTKIGSDGNIIQSGIAMGTSNNIGNYFDVLSVLMMQNGTTLSQGQQVTFSKGLEAQKSNHPALQALRFYTDFARENKAVYSWNESQPDAKKMFTRGNMTFYLGFAHERDEIMQQAGQSEIKVKPLPQLNPESPSNIANYWVQSVTKSSEHKQHAWSFIEFITRPDNVRRYVQATQLPTPLRSQVNPQKQVEEVEPFLKNILTVRSWYNGRDLEAAENAFAELIREYKRPIPKKQKKIQRNARILNNAARKVQQTM